MYRSRNNQWKGEQRFTSPQRYLAVSEPIKPVSRAHATRGPRHEKKKTFPSGCNSCLTLISRGEGEEGGKKRIVRLTSSFYDAFTWALYTPSARHTTSRLHGVIKLSRWWCYNRQFLQKSSRRGCRFARLCRPTAASRRVSSLSRCSRDRRTWKFLAKRACITHKLIHTHTHTYLCARLEA